IVSHTTHFTDMINGVIQAPESPETQGFAPTMMSDLQAANPTVKVQMIQAPQANISGTASLSYSLEMPPARNGMAPNLSIQYSSDAGSGWLGEGWNLSTSSISVETRWGVPRYNPEVETETYLLDGQMLLEDGIGQAHRNLGEDKSGVKRLSGRVKFYPRKESAFSEIVRIGDSPSNYIWEVTDRRGTKYTYGAYKITETKDEYGDVTKDTTIVGVVSGSYQYKGRIVISEWRLTRVEEIHGDYVEYIYRDGFEPLAEGYYSHCLYLDSVKAGNAGEKPHTVVVLKNGVDKGIRQNTARYGYLTSSNKLLESVEVWFEGSLLRSYKFNYTTGAFHSDLLESIVQLDSKGNEFNKHKLEYCNTLLDGKNNDLPLYEENPQTYTANNIFSDNFFKRLKNGFGSELSMINGTSSMDGFSVGGGANIGVGPVVFAGANYNYGHSGGEGRISLTDLNGDGLPDKVYSYDKKLYYQPAIWGSSQFGSAVEVLGAPENFSENTSNSHSLNEDVGVGYSAASISATFAETWDHSRTKTYFSDVNNDGLIDIVYHGAVYFNHLENGHPVFSRFSSQTDNVLGKMSLEHIETEKVTYTDDDLAEIEDSLKKTFPLHDMVRMWRAPFSGKINIDGTVTLIKDNSTQVDPDGVKYYVQVQEENLLSGELKLGESNPTKLSNILVNKGDYVFFRLNSVVQGDSNIVSWNPSIEYASFGKMEGEVYVVDNSIPETNEVGISWKSYNAEKDFIGGVDSMVAIVGDRNVSLLRDPGFGYKKSGKTQSDIVLNVRYKIKGVGSDFTIKTQTITIKADETFDDERFVDLETDEVKAGDTLYLSFFVTSDIPYDPRVISWNPVVQTIYTLPEEGGKTVFDTIYKTPAHRMLNNVISSYVASEMKIGVPDGDDSYVFDEGHENEVKLLVEEPKNVAAKYIRSYLFDEEDKSMTPVKDGDYLPIEKWNGRNVRVITYVDSALGTSHSTMAHFTLNKKETVMTEENVEEEILVADTLQSIASSLYGLFDFEEEQMGQLFHGWGQFAYRGDSINPETEKPVLKEKIKLNELTAVLNLNEEQQNQLNEIVGDEEDFEDLSEEEKQAKQQEKIRNNKDALSGITKSADKNNFFVMSYNTKDRCFYGGTQFAYLSATEMSSSRLGNPVVDVDAEISSFSIEEDQEVDLNGKKVLLSGAAAAPELYSKTFTFSGTLGGGIKSGKFGIGASGSYSTSTTETVKAYMDLNGDGYPDWITNGDEDMIVQYTRTDGVLEIGSAKKGVQLPQQEASAACGGVNGSGVPNPQKNKGSKSSSQANQEAMKDEKKNSSSALSASVSGNISISSSHSTQEWVDVNADGLVDMVYSDGVALNVGYGFIYIKLGNVYGNIDESESSSEAAGASVSVPLCGTANISGGANATFSENKQVFMLRDLSGDGLPDKVVKEGGKYNVYLNLGFGKGFDSKVRTISSTSVSTTKSTAFSIHANGGATIPAFFITITPFVNGSKSFSVSRTLSTISDFDGDGFPDLLESNSEDKLDVRYSRIGATNKLQSVTNPFGGKFTIEYAHTTPTTDHPGGKWAMSALTVDDATGMNPAMKTTFNYENGKRDRREREFLGFGKVTTTNLDEQGNPVRSVIVEYDVQHYLTAGAPIHNLVVSLGTEKDEQGNLVDIKHKEDSTSYVYYNVKNGSELEGFGDDGITEKTSLFMAPKTKKSIAYEYQNDDQTDDETQKKVLERLELSKETFDYTKSYGNLSAYRFRDLTNKKDYGFVGYDDTIQYSDQKLGLATSFEVKGTDGKLYRKVTAQYNDKRTPTAMTQMVQHLDGDKKAVFNFKYDQYGNMVRRTFPTEKLNSKGELEPAKDSTFFEYEYDRKYNMYPERVVDAFGYRNEMEDYDYRYGIPRTVRDMNGYTVRYHIDDLGRTDTIVAPNEQSDGVPYTIAYKYVLDKNMDYRTSYAVTSHYDPQHPNNPLQTVTHVDGLGRPFQVKKDAEIHGKGEKMIVSGRVKYDALGRTDKIYHPTTCDLAKSTEIVEFGNELLVDSTFDAIDRPLTQTLPGDESGDADLNLKGAPSVTVMTYSIETADNDSKTKYLKTTVKDPKDNEQYLYVNGAGQTIRGARAYTKMKDEDSESMEEKVYGIDYVYDPIGQLLTVTDAGGNVTSYTYDMAGRKLSVEHPSAGLITSVYDVAGNMVKKQTPNLAEANKFITYTYDKNRLEKVDYPDHGENNVTYTYGGVNAPHNRVGRLSLVEDGSGATEFFYGRMGEVTKQRRTLVIPNQAVATYTTEWTYDSHNRIQTMTYPDGEVVSYRYNLGGLLSSVSGKKDYTYDYVEEIGYNEYEKKKHMKYGNGVETNYDYSQERRRLDTLVVSNKEGEIMNNAYFYDNLDNITKLVNTAVAQKTKDGKTIGGGVTHNYTYDAWNRLVKASGTFSGAEDKSAKYDLFMAYDELYNVTSKKLNVEQTNLQFPGTLKAGHTLKYQYDRENNDPFRLLSVSASEYRVAVE
ncbi:MAG: hypothetical protein J6T28_09960, partial [Paludibacteraceae bacterium]|nr:hypothetical protein [Paludibacteraceae bacterium]